MSLSQSSPPEPGSRPQHPVARERDAGLAQGILLTSAPFFVVVTICLSLPILPQIAQAFAGQPHIKELVPLIAVLPMLGIALSSAAAGAVGDWLGRRRLLVGSTLLFGLVGVAPSWLHSFDGLLVSRALAGVALGAMVTSAVSLTADYFEGESLQRWLSIQSGAGAAAAVGVSLVAGTLGQLSWRLPFLLLASAFPIVLAMALLPGPRAPAVQARQPHGPAAGPLPWAVLITIFCLTLIGSLTIFPPAYELGAVLEEKMLGGSLLTGVTNAVLAAGAVFGAVASGSLRQETGWAKWTLALAAGGAGIGFVSLGAQIPAVLLGAALIGVGQGFMLPSLSLWLLQRTPESRKGAVVGAFQMVLYLSYFAGPLFAQGLATWRSSVSASLLVYVGLIAAAVLGGVVALTARHRASVARV